MIEQYSAMRNNINMLGHLLGETISDAQGSDILQLIENIRVLSKSSRAGDDQARQQLLKTLQNISTENIIPVARAFSQFLNLTNIAEQYQTISRHHTDEMMSERSISALLARLKADSSISKQQIIDAVQQLLIELVLTAHPTEVTRRSLVHKYVEINNCLERLENADLTEKERHQIQRRLLQLIAQAWHTNEIRTQRPTPFEEAKWGFAVIENSLWSAVPQFLRQLNDDLEEHCQFQLPVDLAPVRFSSWMGGDRDGNPFVTAKVTQQVLYLARWKAAELFLNDIQQLSSELSMIECSAEFRQKYGDHAEPYRVVVKDLRTRLANTLNYFDDKLADRTPIIAESEIITDDEQLWQPLFDCYQSLSACGMRIIANGLLLDCLRRIRCFGVTLSRLDIRQESTRHQQAIAEITDRKSGV